MDDSIQILDCTLRDGGYVNDFKFGKNKIRRIVNKLSSAMIDIIEVGFLRDESNDENKTLFDTVELPFIERNSKAMYVCMLEYGKFNYKMIQERSEKTVDGIRLFFRYTEIEQWHEVKIMAKSLKEKGYNVFIQPAYTAELSDRDILDLIDGVNELEPYALYIVDTLGNISQKSLIHIYRLIEKNLKTGIKIGYHAHNNLQLAYSNALELIKERGNRKIIIDCSVYGMGRGAGNLPTELIASSFGDRYNLNLIYEILNYEILIFSINFPWGYNTAYKVAANCGVHPDYAKFLIDKNKLSINSIFDIIKMIPQSKRLVYDKDFIEKSTFEYFSKPVDDEDAINFIKSKICDRKILVLFPGSSILHQRQKVLEYVIENSPLVVAVNFVPKEFNADILFFGNEQRYSNSKTANESIVLSSNIQLRKGNERVISYCNLVISHFSDGDSSGLMALNLLIKCRAKNIALAGLDGFSRNQGNYYADDMEVYFEKGQYEDYQVKYGQILKELAEGVEMSFITSSTYEKYLKSE